jgi:hypothetical protein
MRALLLTSCVLLTACGGRVGIEDLGGGPITGDGGVTTDTSTSTDSFSPPPDTLFREDTRMPPPPVDTGGPPPLSCEQPVPPDFRCTAPSPVAGKKVCTDVAIRALADGCFGYGATESKCNSAMKKYPACSTCMLEDWIHDNRLAIGACIQKVAPGDKCATTIECTYSCLDVACSECSWEPGSGMGGGSEMDECWEAAASGSCYSIAAKDYEACVSDPKTAVCIPNTVEDLMPFYRGACRDGGDWSRADVPDPVTTDAGGPG